jgi:predicted peptidase
MRTHFLLSIPCLLTLVACSREAESTNVLPGDGDTIDTGIATDGGAADGDLGPKAVIDAHEPTLVTIDRWLVGKIADPSKGDPPRAALEGGSFAMPSEGVVDGVTWRSVVPGKNGELGAASRSGILYGAAAIDLPEKTFLFGRFDNALGAWGNLVPQPGDVYASGRIRVPLASQPGSNVVVVRGFGARGGQVSAQVWSTPDEVVFNGDDATLPDLVVGESRRQWVGVPILNVSDRTAFDIVARIEDSPAFAATEVHYPAVAAHTVTQLAFELVPKAAFTTAKEKVKLTLRLESPTLGASYRKTIELETIAQGSTHRRTFRSSLDGSAQYYGVVPPKDFDASKSYGLVLALHGASVQGIGHAQAYSAKDWAWIVAPTNRRPYGFDWEEWGRLDALEILDLAQAELKTAPERTYVTGHSMGGHGTWQLSVLFPGRFASAGPSAGWISFETYGGAARPTGAIGRAQASSNTLDYVKNLARRSVFVLHGDADDNVPVTEARTMLDVLKGVTSDVASYEHPGGGHWWDGDAAAGADCVDWPALFEFMKAHTLDPAETDFEFVTPSPSVNAKHSFVTIVSAETAWLDVAISSKRAGDVITLTTTNARGLLLDGKVLRAKGIAKVVLDDAAAVDVPEGPLSLGAPDGKHPGAYGPLNDVFRRPFCLVWPDGVEAYRRYAVWLASQWAVTANGHACALPASKVTPELKKSWNLVHLGGAAASIERLPKFVGWDEGGATIAGIRHTGAAIALVFPDGDRLGGAIVAPASSEALLYRYMPFSSRGGMPDFFVWGSGGLKDAGFFASDWSKVDPKR